MSSVRVLLKDRVQITLVPQQKNKKSVSFLANRTKPELRASS